jgi:predicted transcriptional regulator
MIKQYISKNKNEHIWDIPLDTKDPNHPIVTIVIRNWNPFTYVVSLRVQIMDESKEIRRWDNVNRPDHVDIFSSTNPPRKHQKSPCGMIKRLSDLEKIFYHIENNYMRFIKEYEGDWMKEKSTKLSWKQIQEVIEETKGSDFNRILIVSLKDWNPSVLSPRRKELLLLIKEKKVRSESELARMVGRKRPNIVADLKLLEHYGLIKRTRIGKNTVSTVEKTQIMIV